LVVDVLGAHATDAYRAVERVAVIDVCPSAERRSATVRLTVSIQIASSALSVPVYWSSRSR
jgi:hypothetical protein